MTRNPIDAAAATIAAGLLPEAVRQREATGHPLPALIYAAAWPLIERAVLDAIAQGSAEPDPETVAVSTATKDRRSKRWQVVARFWHTDGPELLAETDPEVIESTGTLAEQIPALAEELHGAVPEKLTFGAVRERLPQLRNNLVRSGNAALRIIYEHDREDYLLHVDVYRIDGA